MNARFVQEYGGQKLHITHADANTRLLSQTALCGRDCRKRSAWRMSINLPLGNLCGNCKRRARNVQIIDF